METTESQLIKDRRSSPLRAELRKSLTAKDRTAIPMTEPRYSSGVLDLNLNALYREGTQVYTEEEALNEARRCLDCPTPGCVAACPAGIHIPSFIKAIELGNLAESWQILRERSTLSSICSRVCPHDEQCQGGCIYPLSLKKEAVRIGALERYVATWEQQHRDECPQPRPLASRGQRIAIVGAGPAGLAAAHDLALLGYEPHVYEAHSYLGGVMRCGIPRFRLPAEVIDDEVERLRGYGVVFHTNTYIGKDKSLTELEEEGYAAIFLGTGAGIAGTMGVAGEDLPGVWLANKYLDRTNLITAEEAERELNDLVGGRVAVIGGGNTAMDAVRTAVRLGASRAVVIYRRGMQEMPASREEIEYAQSEGVEFLTLHQVKEYIADDSGNLCGIRLLKMELSEPDESGRRKPVPTGEVIEMEIDRVVVCVGVSQDPILPSQLPDLKTKWDVQIVVDEDLKTSLPMVWAGGDVIRGGATVVEAMRDGRKAAQAIHKYLTTS